MMRLGFEYLIKCNYIASMKRWNRLIQSITYDSQTISVKYLEPYHLRGNRKAKIRCYRVDVVLALARVLFLKKVRI